MTVTWWFWLVAFFALWLAIPQLLNTARWVVRGDIKSRQLDWAGEILTVALFAPLMAAYYGGVTW